MSSAGTVTVDFAAETAKFTSELKKVNSSLKNLESGFSSVSRFARGLLPVLSVGAITSFTRQVFQAADALGDTAQRIGVSVESLSRLKFAAEQNDVEFGSLATSLTRFQRTLSDATSGGRAAASTFASIGVSASSIRNLRLEDQLATIADAFQDIVSPADRTRIAMELFGRAGGQLVPLLSQGSAGIRELSAEADRLGITLNASTAAGIDAADKALKKLSATVGGFFSRRLGDLALSIAGSDDPLVNMQRRIQELTIQRDAFLASSGGSGGPTGSGMQAELQRINAELATLEPRFRALNDLRSGGAASSSGGRRRVGQNDPLLNEFQPFGAGANRIETDQLGETAARFQEENLARIAERQQLVQETAAQAALESQRELGTQLNDAVRQQLEERVALEDFYRGQRQQREIQTEEAILQARRSALSAGISALQSFAGQSKKAAIALVLINKARSIAEAIQNTAVGVTNQLRTGDPYTAIPRAVAVGAFGALQVAAIAASGYGEIQSIKGNGGAPLGSPSNPVFTDGTGNSDGQTFGASDRGSVQITIQGYIGRDQINQMVDALREEIGERDVILIGSNSRQAMELGV